jgi:hypothetical protein
MVGRRAPHQHRVILHRPLVGEPQQRGPVVAERVRHLARLERSAQIVTVRTHDGAYFGTFFCMNGRCPRSARITESGRSRSSPSICSLTASRSLDQIALGRSGSSRFVSAMPERAGRGPPGEPRACRYRSRVRVVT